MHFHVREFAFSNRQLRSVHRSNKLGGSTPAFTDHDPQIVRGKRACDVFLFDCTRTDHILTFAFEQGSCDLRTTRHQPLALQL